MTAGNGWAPEEDRVLLSIAELDEERGWDHVAMLVTTQLGRPITADAARMRTRRIRKQNELVESLPNGTSDEYLFDIPDAPQHTFVGINSIFWDLESTGLTAIMGRLLACAFADAFGQTKVFRIEDYPGRSIIDDSVLAEAIRDEIEKADHWVTWNGKLYDVPFLNARLLKAGKRPVRTDILHTDLMYYAGGQFNRIGSKKLVNVSTFVKSPNRKTELSWEVWQMAAAGDRASMDLVCEHAEADVLVTRDVFAHLKPHVRNIHR